VTPEPGAARTVLIAGALASFVAASALAEPSGVDPAIAPGENFYGYANAAWLRTTPPPADGASLDTSTMLRAQNAQRVRALIEEVSDPAFRPRGRDGAATARKVGDYYASQLDRAAIEARGLAPLSSELAAIAAITDRTALAAYLGRSTRLDDGTNRQNESLWGLWVRQGFHDPRHYRAHIVQGGLGLPEAEDYLDAAPDRAARRVLYRTHVANLLRAAGLDQAEVRAARVVDLETAIAATHASRADTDDVAKTDNDWRAADFVAKAPGLDWPAFFAGAGLAPTTGFVVWQPRAVTGGARLVASQPLEAWKDYLAFHLVAHDAGVLPRSVGDERRAYAARVAGTPAPAQPVAATEAALGDAVARLYVARHFRPETKAAAAAMVENIQAAFRTRLAGVAWMSPQTKARALAKLSALRIGLGYPETWVDYGDLTVVRGDAFGNLQRAEAFAYRHEIAKLGRPVDPDEWGGSLHPQMVGAILNLSPNSMQFAAGLLQPPYFDDAGDAASNYGSVGAGLAHEISHSFDELGADYDAQGRFERWWTAEDLARFRAASAPLAAQLDGCCPAPGLCQHGQQVLAESAADLAGLAVAHDAYLRSLHGRLDIVRDGLTGEQRFFVAFAQRWRRLQSDAALRRQIETDSHAAPQCRANLVRNLAAWADAFSVKPGDPLYLSPEARSHLW
jgi:predicted metalloendopeptidase